jgi:hypothetical protein
VLTVAFVNVVTSNVVVAADKAVGANAAVHVIDDCVPVGTSYFAATIVAE